MGYVFDRWHKSKPKEGEPECGDHKGKVASSVHGKGKRWQARYDGPDGKERTSLHRTYTEADREVTKQESAKHSGSWLDPKAGAVTVEQFALNTWLPAQGIIGRTEREYRGVLRRYLFPEWGGRQIRSIKPSEAGAWQQLLTSEYELTGSTPNRVARYVRSIFKLAVIDRVIAVSPFDGIKAPTLEQSAVHPPPISEVVDLIEHAYRPVWRAMIELTALTGLRSGELRGMRVGQLDLLRKTMRVHDQLVYEPGEGLYFDGLKTSAGLRTVPLTGRAVDVLARHLRDHPPAGEGAYEGLVFAMPGGGPIGESTLDWAFKSICRKAKVRAYRWHDLRHHYASVLIAGGENPKVVQKRLGHKDVMTTLRIYSHLWAEAEEQTRDVLDDAWSKAAEEQRKTLKSGARQGRPVGESSESGGRIPESRAAGGSLSLVKS